MFRHSTPIHLRFSDMDSFGHLNNAKYLTYFEEARIHYYNDLVNWKYDWSIRGIILARAEVDFIVPGHFRDKVLIYTRTSKIGSKSITNEYKMVKQTTSEEIVLAQAITVAVFYNYEINASSYVPEDWRTAISEFEKMIL